MDTKVALYAGKAFKMRPKRCKRIKRLRKLRDLRVKTDPLNPSLHPSVEGKD